MLCRLWYNQTVKCFVGGIYLSLKRHDRNVSSTAASRTHATEYYCNNIMKAKKCHPTDTMNGFIWGPMGQSVYLWHGPLARYVKLRVRMRRECRERFPRHRRWAIPTCITARAWRTCRDACRDRQLSVSFEIGGGGKRSRHSRRMRNLQFYVSGKRSMDK